ncbi:hypothetical protein PR202_gb24144 [Eleusine coracana subsp. coracana]|uniref:Pectinesterase inhibitor domain-containing protein n=1 Tax=Eleusine coracana subsp. coracana TaxID=191504 RepID=A0AAV5FKN0_ELECO|nr:hypothetical protein QOZ80_5BG0445030 [Eleusine coracana subsp. coracana]GJN35375.1 hypothetical protein PR202_gb24144 [Eleusine coracana subsp. coracana]
MAAAASPKLPALLLFVFIAAAGVAAAETTTAALDEVCRGLGGFYVTPELCASALCSDPSSPCRAARDAPAVAALAARLAARNATATQAALSSSLAAGNATSSKEEGVRACLELYGVAVAALRWAAASVAAGRFRGAREVLFAAQYVPAGCDGMAGDAAALRRENGGFSYMAMVAHAVVASMIRD